MTTGADGIYDPGIGHRCGVAFALQLKFLTVDAARDVRREDQQQVDRFGRADGSNGWRVRERQGKCDAAEQAAHSESLPDFGFIAPALWWPEKSLRRAFRHRRGWLFGNTPDLLPQAPW